MANKQLAYAAATNQAAGTVNGPVADNIVGKACHIVVDITALTGTLTVTLEGFDPASGKFYTILASTAIAATGTTVLKVGPGLTAAANSVANDVLPANFRIKQVIATGPASYTIGMSIID